MTTTKQIACAMFVGSMLGCTGVRNPEQGWRDVLYKEENIPVLEHILEQETAYFETVPLPEPYIGSEPEEAAVPIFNTLIKKKLETFLEIEDINPKISVARKDPWERKRNIPISAVGIANILAGVIGFNLCRKTIRRDPGAAIQYGLSGILFLLIGYSATQLAYEMMHSNRYNNISDTVLISYKESDYLKVEDPKTLAIGIGHEVTHAIQQRDAPEMDGTLKEGHAEGTIRNVGKQVFEETKDPHFVEPFRTYDLDAFASVYVDMCKEFEKEPKKEFAQLATLPPLEKHTLGFTLFAIREQQWGDRIYQDVLNGDFCRVYHSPEEKVCE